MAPSLATIAALYNRGVENPRRIGQSGQVRRELQAARGLMPTGQALSVALPHIRPSLLGKAVWNPHERQHDGFLAGRGIETRRP